MILQGDGSWPFNVQFSGTFQVDNVVATWFGGDSDPQDSGQTACGFPTKGHPDLLGCALPMELCTRSTATMGAPFPHMPWGLDSHGVDVPSGCHVLVWRSDDYTKSVTVPLIDLGPAKSASRVSVGKSYVHNALYIMRETVAKASPQAHAIDLTRAAFLALGGDLNAGIIQVGFKVIA